MRIHRAHFIRCQGASSTEEPPNNQGGRVIQPADQPESVPIPCSPSSVLHNMGLQQVSWKTEYQGDRDQVTYEPNSRGSLLSGLI